MNPKLVRFALVFGLAAVVGLLFVPIHPVSSVLPTTYLQYTPVAPPAPGVHSVAQYPIPADCSTWHELWPNFCIDHHQTGYEDGGDGNLSECDNIILDGVTWHVDWVGPTYHFVEVIGGVDTWTEPSLDPGHNPDNPTGEVWHVVYPDFCAEFPIDGWDDNGDGTLSPCDVIVSGGKSYHLVDVTINIITSEPGTPIEQSTWGLIKTFFSDKF